MKEGAVIDDDLIPPAPFSCAQEKGELFVVQSLFFALKINQKTKQQTKTSPPSPPQWRGGSGGVRSSIHLLQPYRDFLLHINRIVR